MFIIITPWIQISNTALKGTFATVALVDILAAVSAGALVSFLSAFSFFHFFFRLAVNVNFSTPPLMTNSTRKRFYISLPRNVPEYI